MGEPKRVAIWVRVSHEDQVKGESPEHHEYRGRMYAESKGWTVVKVYRLDAISGKSVMGLPQTEEMLRDVSSGVISGLIFSKLARLARNTRELLDFSDFFRERGADLISLAEAIDTSTPHGRVFYTNLAALAQLEREEIASRVAASVPIRAKLGKPLGGAGAFGYVWKDRKLVPHPDEAPVRKLIYELFREHRRLKTVARLLNDAGHRTRNGGHFTHTTVERLIRDTTAKGLHRANYSKSKGEGKSWILKPEEDWIYTEVEPIVPEALWEECNRFLDDRRQTRKPPARRPVHLFTGYAFCDCGGKLAVPSNSPKYICPKCRNKIPIEDLERVFEGELQNFLLSSERIERYLEDCDGALKEKEDLLEALSREQEKLNAEMEKTYRLYLEDAITPQGFKERYGPLEVRAAQLKEEVPRVQGEIDFMRVEHRSQETILEEARYLYSHWGDLDFAERRRIVEGVVEQITVGKEDVSIELSYLPSPSEFMAERAHTGTDSSRLARKTGPGTGAGRGRAPR
jgi:site-specific DNA recombinase